MSKVHKIKTIEDLLNLATDENFERLMQDFVLFAYYAVQIKKNRVNQKIESVGFDWVDDCKSEIKFINVNGKEIKL